MVYKKELVIFNGETKTKSLIIDFITEEFYNEVHSDDFKGLIPIFQNKLKLKPYKYSWIIACNGLSNSIADLELSNT